jgi:peptidoglycan/LPS O-acetylase OafA/YrhL
MATNYIRSLDGLRALAVTLVLLNHWPFPGLSLPFGWSGVSIFFVLSGFLITRILFASREKPLKEFLSRFYRNRILRIFPLYFAYLLGIAGLLYLLNYFIPEPPVQIAQGYQAVKNDLLYLLTYTYNFQDLWHLLDGKDDSNHVRFFSHLWSLCVEEQYYLVFPFVIYFLPPKKLKILLASIVFLSPVFRLIIGEAFRGNIHGDFFTGMVMSRLPFFYFDAFALGSLLVLWPIHRISRPQRWLFAYLILITALGLTETYFLRQNGSEISWKSLGFNHPLYQYLQPTAGFWLNTRYALTFTFINIGAALLVLSILQPNKLTDFLSKPFAVWFGKISYGIYIFHFPILALLLSILEYNGLENYFKENRWLEITGFLAYFLLTTFIAHLSFKYFESRFLRLKH